MNNFIKSTAVFAVYAIAGIFYYTCYVQGSCLFSGDESTTVQETTAIPDQSKSTPVEITPSKPAKTMSPTTVKTDTENSVTDRNIDTSTDVKASSETTSTPISTEVVKETINTLPAPASASGMNVYDADGKTLFGYRRPVGVQLNNATVSFPNNNARLANKILPFLNADKNKILEIIGQYDQVKETADIGQQRATMVMNFLKSKGVSLAKMSTKTMATNLDFDTTGVASGGVRFAFAKAVQNEVKTVVPEAHTKTTTQQVATTTETVKPKPRVTPSGFRSFTRGFDGDDFKPTAAFRAHAIILKNQVLANPARKVYVYAHTDGIGNATDNYNISKQNTRALKAYMQSLGIPAGNLVTIPKGESQPMTSGAKVKRIELFIK